MNIEKFTALMTAIIEETPEIKNKFNSATSFEEFSKTINSIFLDVVNEVKVRQSALAKKVTEDAELRSIMAERIRTKLQNV